MGKSDTTADVDERGEDSVIGDVIRAIDRHIEWRHIDGVIGIHAGVGRDIGHFHGQIESRADCPFAWWTYFTLLAQGFGGSLDRPWPSARAGVRDGFFESCSRFSRKLTGVVGQNLIVQLERVLVRPNDLEEVALLIPQPSGGSGNSCCHSPTALPGELFNFQSAPISFRPLLRREGHHVVGNAIFHFSSLLSFEERS